MCFEKCLQHEVERDEDRELRDQRQARRGRVDVVLLVELHHLLVQLLPVALVLPLDLLHLRRVLLQRLHRVDLPDRQRHEQRSGRRSSSRRSPRPTAARVVVEAVEQPPHGVLERLRMLKTSSERITGSRPRRATTGCSAGARQPASAEPLHEAVLAQRLRSRTPSSSGGTCRCRRDEQAERPAVDVDEPDPERARRAARASAALMPPPSRAPRRPARRATRGRAPRPPRAARAARRARSRSRRDTPPSSLARQISRSWRLIRLRTTLEPAAFGTASRAAARPARSSRANQ